MEIKKNEQLLSGLNPYPLRNLFLIYSIQPITEFVNHSCGTWVSNIDRAITERIAYVIGK